MDKKELHRRLENREENMNKKLLSMAAVLLFISAPAWAQDYTMRPGDELNIVFTQEPNLGNTQANASPFTVRPDGKISFPMAGEIDVQGMTVSQFTETLRTRLSRYFVDPDISVNLVKLGAVRVYIFGEVNKPGVYELTKSHRVMDAIGAASGFNWDTAKKKIFLIHQDDTDKPIAINLNHILQTGDMSQNYIMQEGDILYLTKNSRINFARDIAPFLSGAYMISEIKNNND